MSPFPNELGGRPGGQGRTRNQRAQDGAAADGGTAGECALAQEAETGVAGDFLGGLANGTIGVNGFEIDMSHVELLLSDPWTGSASHDERRSSRSAEAVNDWFTGVSEG